MSKLVLKLVILSAPFIILLGIIFGIPFYIGETMPLSLVVEMQEDNENLIVSSPRERVTLMHAYKILMANKKQATLMVSGSSRMHRLPSNVANKQPNELYNMAIPGTHFWDFVELMGYVNAEAQPEILIWGIDQATLMEGFEIYWGIWPPLFDNQRDLAWYVKETMLSWEQILEKDTQKIFDNKTEDTLGVVAILQNDGFMPDGTYEISDLSESFVNRRWAISERHFENKAQLVQTGETYSTERLIELEKALQQFSEQGTFVIGVFPPFAPSFYNRMMKDNGYDYIEPLSAEIKILFESYDFPFFDFTDPASISVTDANFTDGWHLEERGAVQLYLEIAKALPDVFNSYTDIDYLQELLSASDNPYILFPHEFD